MNEDKSTQGLDGIICAFCEKHARDVKTIIKSTTTCEATYICDECVLVCVQVIFDRTNVIRHQS